MEDDHAAAVAQALSHPLRIAFLRALRGRERLSPSEFAREDSRPLGSVSYHVKALREASVIEVVDTAKRRGALEHYYSLTGPNAKVTLRFLDLLAEA
jgi:DNA-binding transcriptional ArsR family regulator